MDCRKALNKKNSIIPPACVCGIILFYLFVASICNTIHGETSRKTTISVYELKSIGISQTLAASLQEHLESNLLKYGQFDVMSRNDIDLILKENRFVQTGICSEEDCAVQAGHILGVQKIITGTISMVGSTYNIVLKMIDVSTAKLESSVNQRASGSVDTLLDVVENSLNVLLEKGSNKEYNSENVEKLKSELADLKTREQELQVTCNIEKARAGRLQQEHKELEDKNRELERVKNEYESARGEELPQESFNRQVNETNREDTLEEQPYETVIKNHTDEHTKKLGKKIGIGAATIFSAIGISVLIFQLSGNK